MSVNTITSFIMELRTRALVACAAVGLAIIPAMQEHKARAAGNGAVEIPAAVPEKTAGLSPEPKEPVYSALTPNPLLIRAVKAQTAQKPTFDKKSKNYEEIIQEIAGKHEVSPALVKAVIQAESRFNSQAVSSQGAVGLMQVLPSTARSVGVRSPLIPKENITAGVKYLKVLLKEFGDEEYLAIAAYNCGPDMIRRHGNKLPPFTETRIFVAKVMEYYQSHISDSEFL
ncbi:MAG: lytic transglycosylase domain-containing protein [Deltaproteobacteria bacterium]|jgi:soluble lytic murein transglycosylase-like protein|nr:lytic transglycosylase domain-containing protein [Deltaproteobacteria bacterium]